MKATTPSYKLQREFGVEDMRRFAKEAWGEIGANVVDKWVEFNKKYFASKLRIYWHCVEPLHTASHVASAEILAITHLPPVFGFVQQQYLSGS